MCFISDLTSFGLNPVYVSARDEEMFELLNCVDENKFELLNSVETSLIIYYIINILIKYKTIKTEQTC